MNLMFRKNFGGEKGLGGGGSGGGYCGVGAVGGGGGGLREVRPILGTYGTGGVSFGQLGTRFGAVRGIGSGSGHSVVSGSRGPIQRSREFGYFPSMGDHEHQGHGYRTHLFLSPPAGGTLCSPPDDTCERLGPPPRRSSGPHVIKWGGGSGSTGSGHGPQIVNQAKRKQNQINQQRQSSDPPSPIASRQVGAIAKGTR